MTALTADQIAKKWSSNLSASGPTIQAGVEAVKVAPGQAAARQQDVWATAVAQSKQKWAARVSAVTLPEWQAAMVDKGLQRIATGATAAEPKFATFMGKLLPHIDRVKSQLQPRGNLEQNIARMTAFVRGMATFNN